MLAKLTKTKRFNTATIKAGRRIGSRVKLTPFARKLYPQLVGKIGRITNKEILTKGQGLIRSAYRFVPYKVAYYVRFSGESRDYLLGSDSLMKV